MIEMTDEDWGYINDNFLTGDSDKYLKDNYFNEWNNEGEM